MTSIDPARSRRKDKRTLFATLDMAIIQSGVNLDADTTYALSVWSMDQGRRFPWYYHHEKDIVAAEGGYDSIVLEIAGLALGLAVDMDNPKDAFFYAGVEWRDGIRRQWGDGSARKDWHVPKVFTDIEHDVITEDGRFNKHYLEDWLTEHSMELAPPSEPFDPDDIKDPRLRQLWERATPEHREVMQLVAEGTESVPAGELLGIRAGTFRQRKASLKRRALAMGPAA